VDVSEAFLAAVIERVGGRWPELPVIAERADIGDALPVPATVPRPVLFAFLGSTIGNFATAAAVALLRRIRSRMCGADRLLLGVDLRPGAGKPAAEVEAAYNDARGVTADFNRNLLRVLNRELGADFDVEAFEHEAFYDPSAHRVEMRLVARVPQRIEIPGAGWFRVEAGEAIRTEISGKYDRVAVEALLARAALRLERWAADAGNRFALALAVPRP
jgi:L-histidine N-alpha-methyltransferase